MKILISTLLILVSLPVYAATVGVVAAVTCRPMLNFTAETTALEGFAVKTAKGFEAKNVRLDLRTLKTKNELRDKHTQQHLETDKFPFAVLTVGQAAGAEGTGHLQFHGVDKDIKGTVKALSATQVEAKFRISLKDFNISGIKYMGAGVQDPVDITVVLPLQSAK